MKPIPHLLGIAAGVVILYLTYTHPAYHSERSFYVATTASSYILYSSLALALTRIGKTRRTKAWAFFLGGFVAISAYLPAIRHVVDLFYLDQGFRRELFLPMLEELYFWSPIIVGSLCVYRAIVMWTEESLDRGTK